MTTSVSTGSFQADPTWQPSEDLCSSGSDPSPALATEQVVAQTEEFVALPGVTPKLRKLLPAAFQRAYGGSSHFLGCIVLISEQEARLVTVLTLWTAKAGAEIGRRNSAVLQDLLEPYVDRWMRSGSFAALLNKARH